MDSSTIVQGALVDDSLPWADTLGGVSPPSYPEYAPQALVSLPIFGESHVGDPVQLTEPKTGYAVNAFFADYYNRVHVVPGRINVGNILSSTVKKIEVWNAYLHSNMLSAVSVSNDPGVYVTSPDSVPIDYTPLKLREYAVNVTTEGPSDVNALLMFSFASGDTVAAVTGSRIILWLPCPQESVTETLEWKTNVLRTRTGEQRFSLRQSPRTSLTYNHIFDERQAFKARTLVKGRQHYRFGVPVWTDRQFIGPLTSGATTITLPAQVGDYRVGEPVILWQSEEVFEALTVATISGATITVTLPTTVSFTGAYAMPVRFARATGLELQRGACTTTTGTINFEILANTDWSKSASFPTLDGLEIMTDMVYSVSDHRDTIVSDVFSVDNSVGLPAYLARYDYADQTFTVAWDMKSQAEVERLRRWLHTRKGKWKSFWLPSGSSDFEVLENIAPSSTGIKVRNVGYSLYYSSNTRAIRVKKKDGTVHYFLVTGATEYADGEILTLSTQAGVTVNRSDIAQASLVRRVRFNTDRFEISFESYGMIVVSATVVEVPE